MKGTRTLDPSLFTQGFLVMEWYTDLSNLIPDNQIELVAAILHSQWQTLFVALCETHSNILHETHNYVTQQQHETCECDLSLFKQNALEWLGPWYLFLANYNLTIMNMEPNLIFKYSHMIFMCIVPDQNWVTVGLPLPGCQFSSCCGGLGTMPTPKYSSWQAEFKITPCQTKN